MTKEYDGSTPLKGKQELFCRKYVACEDKNQTNAAIDAGYSKKSARTSASGLMKNCNILKRIMFLTQDVMQQCQVDAEHVLRRHFEIDQLDVLEIIDPDTGELKPIRKWPKHWRQSINGLEISTARAMSDDESTVIETTLSKLKWPDKVKNLALLGKHTNVQAYKEAIQHQHDLSDDFESLMNDAADD